MIYLMFCSRCMSRARFDYDQTPAVDCNFCNGTGYVKTSRQEIAKFLAHEVYNPTKSR